MTETQPPSFMDHHLMLFWLWAFIQDAETFLITSNNRIVSARSRRRDGGPTFHALTFSQEKMDLDKYHLISTLGHLLRVLRRSHRQFPEIEPAYSKASHLLAEGKNLRDMTEHADEYFEGKGRLQNQFVRQGTAQAEGSETPIRTSIAATAMLIDARGHWLGGRLHVETCLAEVRAIYEIARSVPVPKTDPEAEKEKMRARMEQMRQHRAP